MPMILSEHLHPIVVLPNVVLKLLFLLRWRGLLSVFLPSAAMFQWLSCSSKSVRCGISWRLLWLLELWCWRRRLRQWADRPDIGASALVSTSERYLRWIVRWWLEWQWWCRSSGADRSELCRTAEEWKIFCCRSQCNYWSRDYVEVGAYQWWSMFNTHLLHVRQWWVLSGLKIWQMMQ